MLKQYGEDVVLPTFSKRFADGNVIRGMRDTGCQPNFITNEAARRLGLKIVKTNHPLTVHGFNTVENIKTNVVELKFNEDEPPVVAICVPKVKINLKLPGLGQVVKSFISRGYEFANEFFTESSKDISNLDFLLGNNDGQVLPLSDVKFGTAPCSVYSATPLGVALSGSVKRYLRNVSSLRVLNANTVNVKDENSDIEDSLTSNYCAVLKSCTEKYFAEIIEMHEKIIIKIV